MNITASAFATGGELFKSSAPNWDEDRRRGSTTRFRRRFVHHERAAPHQLRVRRLRREKARRRAGRRTIPSRHGPSRPSRSANDANRSAAAANNPAIVFTPPAKGLVGLSRENPQLAILVACLIMGLVQIGMVGLTIFMVRDAGYSSGWGDATKYFVDCQK